ncbi:hypothetical protein MTO96_014616 [Rhipicephalus appendiculatus]
MVLDASDATPTLPEELTFTRKSLIQGDRVRAVVRGRSSRERARILEPARQTGAQVSHQADDDAPGGG